jgi:glucose-1-phosphate adenylyltransferase
MSRSLAMILAGGRGARLGPLTCHRAKPAVPFGGRYRIIDFVLSNMVNSDHRRVYVLTQYMATSLIKHLQRNWHVSGLDGFIEVVPAQMRMGSFWYRGTADAIAQNRNLIRDSRADLVAIFGGDHIYKMDLRQMEEQHLDTRADLTIAACPVPRSEASRFGIIQVDTSGRIVGFQEKPKDPAPMPGRPDTCLASMGNYVFDTGVLLDALHTDDHDESSSHDFGKDVIPALMAAGAAIYAYDFGQNRIDNEPEKEPYWRDVGTIDSYVQANMDVRSRVPHLNLYNRRWRIRTAQRDYPPARVVENLNRGPARIRDSLICEGSIISSVLLENSLVGYDCFVHAGAELVDSILLAGCDIGAGARVHKVLLDKNVSIDPGAEIGLDPVRDRERFPWITPGGWVTLPKGTRVPKDGPIELAGDMGIMLRNDDVNAADLAAVPAGYSIGDRQRHSYESAGPRYRRLADHADR